MLSLPSTVRIFAATLPQDMRKSFDGLASVTRSLLGQEPMSGSLYLYFNRSADLVKVLWWDRGGWCLFSKRLARGRFTRPPTEPDATHVTLDATTLAMILDGVDLARIRRKARFEPGAAAAPEIHAG
jgi:transposase